MTKMKMSTVNHVYCMYLVNTFVGKYFNCLLALVTRLFVSTRVSLIAGMEYIIVEWTLNVHRTAKPERCCVILGQP